MTDEAPKPKRKRWRWILAGILLFVAAGAGWWYWPRGDARFVGSWVLVNNIGQSEGAYRFLPNGIAELYGESDDSKPILMGTYRWSSDWPILRLRPTGNTWLQGAEASDSAVPTDREGFRPLRLRDFEQFAAKPNTWREESGMIATNGQPKGHIYSKRSYQDFTWRAEFRFIPGEDASKADQSNTGFMLCIQEPHKTWPKSLEVQGKWIEMAHIKPNGGAAELKIKDDQAAREAARKPVGEWNVIEIVVKDGAVSSVLNGKPICTAEPGELKSGRIGLQAELFPVEFRNVKIKEE